MTTEFHWAQKSYLLKHLQKAGSIEASATTGYGPYYTARIRDLKLAITYRPEQLIEVLEEEVEVTPSCFRGLTTTEFH